MMEIRNTDIHISEVGEHYLSAKYFNVIGKKQQDYNNHQIICIVLDNQILKRQS